LTKPVNNNLPKWQVAPEFESRVKEAFGGAPLTEIAPKTGENYHTLRNYLKLKRDPPPRFLIAIAELTNYSPYWLLTGKGAKMLSSESLLANKRVDTALSPETKAHIRREILEILSSMSVVLSSRDREMADSLVKTVESQIEKGSKK
jgi:hypothetical protein